MMKMVIEIVVEVAVCIIKVFKAVTNKK